ncbi:hypothetical protein DOY81_002321, partial [Sarcophaga bullata]
GLLSLLRKLRPNPEKEARILLLGLDNAGKTTILKQLANEEITTVYVIDCTDRERLAETGNELFEMLMDNRLKQVPLLVFANKQDLPNAMSSSEVAEAIGLVRLEERTWQIKACSAVEGTGIKEGMDWVCKNMKK